ncbi:MAG: hypothetical protein PHY46_00995 [Candidatus Omnitrophica bacterium]|nr:hypothetical protein [Candidatus Omnitrophota bacterium]MDD5355332.1 hypothetical protein [Candidatus Omnitrophota bacterium]
MAKGLIILVISACMLSGCICVSGSQRKDRPEDKMVQLEQLNSDKATKIIQLQNLLADKERQIDEKDLKIEEMRKKLEMFGVFEK